MQSLENSNLYQGCVNAGRHITGVFSAYVFTHLSLSVSHVLCSNMCG